MSEERQCTSATAAWLAHLLAELKSICVDQGAATLEAELDPEAARLHSAALEEVSRRLPEYRVKVLAMQEARGQLYEAARCKGDWVAPAARLNDAITLLWAHREVFEHAQPGGGPTTNAVPAAHSSTPPEPAAPAVEQLPLPTPTIYLFSWREVLDTVNLKNEEQNQRRVAELNRQYGGPIILPGRGGQPKVSKAKLLEWWNHLEIIWQTTGEGRNAEATLQGQHAYGRTGTVLPDISGHARKRRRKKGGG
jgi:hypothetical protein